MDGEEANAPVEGAPQAEEAAPPAIAAAPPPPQAEEVEEEGNHGGDIMDEDEDDDDDEDADADEDEDEVVSVESFVNTLLMDESFFHLHEVMTDGLQNFSDADMQRVYDMVSEEPRMKPSRLWIDLRGIGHDMGVAKRVTKLMSYYDVRGLEEIEIKYNDTDSAWARRVYPHHLQVVEHYLAFLSDSVAAGACFELVDVPFLGNGDGSWSRFLNQFTVNRLRIGAHWTGSGIDNVLNAKELVRTLSCLSPLPPIELRLCTWKASPSVALLFQALQHVNALESLSIVIHENLRRDTAAAIDGLCGLVLLSKSLRSLSVSVRPHVGRRRLDYRPLLESVLHSDVLEELKLEGGTLLKTSVLPDDETTNQSTKRMEISNCDVGASGWSVLHRFKGLRTLKLINIKSHSYQVSYHDTLFRLPRLEAFSDSSICYPIFDILDVPSHWGSMYGYFRRFCRQTHLAELAKRISDAPNLSNLSLETTASDREGHDSVLPALKDLLQRSKGSLTLFHEDEDTDGTKDGETNFSQIRTGLDTSSLTELNLGFKCRGLTPPSLIAFLSVLHRKSNLKVFTGYFYVASEWDPGCLDTALFDLLTSSTHLKTFGLRLQALESSSRCRLNDAVLGAVLRSLQHNQSVTTLVGAARDYYWHDFDALLASLRSLLQHNTTLEHLLDYCYDEPIELDIKWRLDLNRYKRRYLLEPGEVPLGCLPSVLERIAMDSRADVMYHFLKRLPRSALRTNRGLRRLAPAS